MNENLGPLAPEIILAVSAVAGLLAGSWLPRDRQWVVRAMAVAACLAGLAAAALAATEPAAPVENCITLGVTALPELSSMPDAVTVIRASAGSGSMGVRINSWK